MAVEIKRGCGYRKIHGTYLVGDYINVPCDRLPFPIEACPVCGGGIHFTRSLTEINPLKLFGVHNNCVDTSHHCFTCNPTEEPAFIMMVGEKFYPTVNDFINEGVLQGVSKRIPFVPKKFKVGKTIIYLAHRKAFETREPLAMQQAMNILEKSQPRLIDAEIKQSKMGIFCAFIPQRIEKLYWESELTDKLKKKLKRQGITPVSIPDGDKDHT
jgi:hypothetical protein